jgi:hypothetical protein
MIRETARTQIVEARGADLWWWFAVGAVMVVTGLVRPALHAQRPEAQQEVKLPGMDVSLKAGWQMFFHQGCRFAVPGSWLYDADGSRATAPDGSTISIAMFNVTNWSAHKAQVKAAFGRVTVTNEDSEHRLWFVIGDEPRLQHYIDVWTGMYVCSASLDIRGMTSRPENQDTVRRIADSVGPAPGTWPQPR